MPGFSRYHPYHIMWRLHSTLADYDRHDLSEFLKNSTIKNICSKLTIRVQLQTDLFRYFETSVSAAFSEVQFKRLCKVL